jgi:hypothetical protein
MIEPNVEIRKGKDLSIRAMKQINAIWQKAFPGNEPVEPRNKKLFSKDTFFIVRDSKGMILSVGRLRPVKLTFLKKVYYVQGIADIVSVLTRRGYGKVLMHAMQEYLDKTKRTGVGFCIRKNSPFYHKGGFRTAKNLARRFLYKNPEGQIIKGKGTDDVDVIYLSGKDKFIEKVLADSKEKVLIPIPHW